MLPRWSMNFERPGISGQLQAYLGSIETLNVPAGIFRRLM